MVVGMTSANYEAITAAIVCDMERMASRLQGAQVGSGVNNRILGGSGYRHQIDVSILLPNGQLHLIDCKLWSRPVGLSEVLVIQGRLDDIRRCHQGDVTAALVSASGYTSNATNVAKYFDIGLEDVHSTTHYGLRVLGSVAFGVESSFALGDWADAEVVKGR